MDINRPPCGHSTLNAVISESSSGANEVVAAVTGKRISLISFYISPSAAVNFKWQSAATDLTGLFYCSAASDDKSYQSLPICSTAAGEALNLNLSGAVAVGGVVTYVLE